MKAISAFILFHLEAIGEQTFIYKNFEGLQFASYAINWHGIVYACRPINELYAC